MAISGRFISILPKALRLQDNLLFRQLSRLILAMSLVSIVTIALTISALYFQAREQHGRLLMESVQHQVTLLRSIRQRYQNETGHDDNVEGRLIFNTIQNMLRMNKDASVTGNSSEFVVAERRGEHIVFLLLGADFTHEHELAQTGEHGHQHLEVPFDSRLAEPMRQALLGKSGVITGLDHHGEKVLAAFQYLPEYKLGIVFKVNSSELLSPYLLVIFLASAIALALICIAAYAFYSSFRLFYAARELQADSLRKQHQILSGLGQRDDINPCDFDSIFEEITRSSCEGLNVARSSIWLFNDDHTQLLCADLFDSRSALHGDCKPMRVIDFPLYFSELSQQRMISSNDVNSDSATVELLEDYLRPHGIVSMLDLSIQLNGENLGVFCNEHCGDERAWSDSDQAFARSIADYIATTMNQCRRNKAEQRLQESELRYDLAVAGSNDGLWDWDMESNRVYRSAQFKYLLGYPRQESTDDIAVLFKDLHVDDRTRVQDALQAHLENPAIRYDIEYRMRTHSGVYRWFRCRGSALRDNLGKPYRFSGSLTDINDLKQLEADLARFKLTLDELTDNLLMFDPDSLKIFYVNKSVVINSGFSEQALLEMTLPDMPLGFGVEKIASILAQVRSQPNQSFNFEARFRHQDGRSIPVDIRLQYVIPADSCARFVAIVRDVTERNRAARENRVQRSILGYIYQLQQDFISGEPRGQVFQRTLSAFLETSQSEFGFIGEVAYLSDKAPYLSVSYMSEACVSDLANSPDVRDPQRWEKTGRDDLISAVFSSGQAVMDNDPALDTRLAVLPGGHPPLSSFMAIPLKLGERLTGIIGLANRPKGYSERIIKRLQPLIATCANLLEAERSERLRESVENALRRSEEEANAVLATVADGIITIDECGIVESFNLAAQRIFGYPESEVIGRNVNMLMPEPFHSAHDGYLARHRAGAEASIVRHGVEVEGLRKDGSVFPMDLSVSVTGSTETRRYTGIIRDIGERKRIEQALVAARDEAERANLAKSEFLSSMSHELRTPLNAIMGFAQLMEMDGSLTGIQSTHSTEIYNAGKLLLELINDVLDLARIESGHVKLSIEAIALPQIMREACSLIKPQADSRGIEVTVSDRSTVGSGCSEVWVLADYTRLKQVLLNILSNAVKYNRPQGSIDISCQPAAPGYHRLCIRDSGIGMQAQDLQNLFQPFNRLGAENSEIEGTGIGLVITRELVQRMQGSIEVESEPGVGTTFILK